MKIKNINELDNSLKLLNKSYIKDKITFYDNKIDKVIFILQSALIAYFTFLLFIYSDFFSHYFEFQIIFTVFSLFILLCLLGGCEYFLRYYNIKKKMLYANIKETNYNLIFEDLFFEESLKIDKNKLFPLCTGFLYSLFIIIFYFYIFYYVCNDSLLLLIDLSISNIVYFYYIIISISFIIFFVVMLIVIKTCNAFITKKASYSIFAVCFVVVICCFPIFQNSAWNLKINLEKGHTLLYREVSHNISKRLERSMTTVKIVLEDKNTENCTQDDFVKTAMCAAKEYHNKYSSDITRIFLLCQNTGNNVADRILATIDYIPDGKGMNGKRNNLNWINLLSVKKGYNVSELDYLKIYAENREKYDDELALKIFIEEKLKKRFYRSPLDNEPLFMEIINHD